MVEIKRARVPFGRTNAPRPSPSPTKEAKTAEPLLRQPDAEKIRLRKLQILDDPQAVAFIGNALTGCTNDARVNLPPLGYNPPPKRVMAKRKLQLKLTFARRPAVPPHSSASEAIQRLTNPKTQHAASLQRLINIEPKVRAAFERATMTKVVLDRRMDGTITAIDQTHTNAGVAKSAMASSANGASESLYDLLRDMEEDLLRQAAAVQAAQSGNIDGGGAGSPFGDGLGLGGMLGTDLFSSTNPFGEDEEDEDGWNTNLSIGAMSGGSVDPRNMKLTPGSTDEAVAKVQIAVQRFNQMYSLISGMYAKYHQLSMSEIANLKS